MCGIFGLYGDEEAANLSYLGLHALQHRGQESAGIATSDTQKLHYHRSQGRVASVFDEAILNNLKGDMAIGHVRYSTSGSSQLKNAQPMVVKTQRGAMALAHNGNLVNASTLRHDLEQKGAIFHSDADTEVLLHLLAHSQEGSVSARLKKVLCQVKGAYSLVIMTEDALWAVRDPFGFRPLVLGKRGEAYLLASESSAFSLLEAEYVREIEPGEILRIDKTGLHSEMLSDLKPAARCVFEYVYFSRPDSHIFDRSTYDVRKEMGRALARLHPVKADAVIPVPDSGMAGALGFAEEAGIPLEMGLIRSHYVGRTFIEPAQSIRSFGVRLKLSPVKSILNQKRVVIIDDSIVRGTTSRKIVALVRQAGAQEVHMRVCSPPIISPCYYGIDTPSQEELLAPQQSLEGMRQHLGCDSLGFLDQDTLFSFQNGSSKGFCHACFSRQYPVDPESN